MNPTRLAAALLPLAVGCTDVETVIAEWRLDSKTDASVQTPPLTDNEDSSPPALPMLPMGPQDSSFYFEAEAGVLSGGFAIGDSTDASGGRFIVATEYSETSGSPGGSRARYSFELRNAGDYLVWGRIHSPGANNNRYWVRMDQGEWFLWRISTGDVYHWDDLHDNLDYQNPVVFSLNAGPHQLELANAVPGAELDRFYVTSKGDEPPGNTTPCDPPHSIELFGRCVPSCGSFQLSKGIPVSCAPEVCEAVQRLPVYDCEVCCFVPTTSNSDAATKFPALDAGSN